MSDMFLQSLFLLLSKRSDFPATLIKRKWKIATTAAAISNIDREVIFKTLLQNHNLISAYDHSLEFLKATAGDDAVKKPTEKTPPVGINPESINIWKDTIKKQSKIIYGFSSSREQWAAAIVLYKRECASVGVAAFIQTTRKHTSNPVAAFLASYVQPCLTILGKIEKYLNSKRLVAKKIPKVYSLADIKLAGIKRKVYAKKSIRILKGEDASAVINLLVPKFGFKKLKQNSFVKKISPHAYVKVRKAQKGNAIDAFIVFSIAKNNWNNLATNNKKQENYLRGWIKRGFQATGSVSRKTFESKFNLKYIIATSHSSDRLIITEEMIYKALANKIEVPDNLYKFIADKNYRQSAIEIFG
jgi:hypothetical protein